MAGDGQHLTHQSAFKITATIAAKGPRQGRGALTCLDSVGRGRKWQVMASVQEVVDDLFCFGSIRLQWRQYSSQLSIWHLVDNLNIFKVCTNEYGEKNSCYCSTFGPVSGALGPHHRYLSFPHVLSILLFVTTEVVKCYSVVVARHETLGSDLHGRCSPF